MKLAILRETRPGETRVAITPETVTRLGRESISVVVEAGAGEAAHFSDQAYRDAGATVLDDAAAVVAEGDVLVKIHPPAADEAGRDELALLRPGLTLVSLLSPLTDHDGVRRLTEAKVTALSLDLLPRITRSQSMDVLSSMATLAGYKAVLLAGSALGRLMPMMMTAAGTLPPAKVLVIGAGVAGLQAIATARRLGGVVKAVDTRPAVKEQVESLSAQFVPLEVSHEAEDTGGYAKDLGEDFYRQEQEILTPHVEAADVVISTAMIPGRAAPILMTEDMVKSMKDGSVIVDLAVTTGGNCTLSRPDETVTAHGVAILGPTNLPATMPVHGSAMFSRNMASLLKELTGDEGQLNLDMDNEIVSGMIVCRDGEIETPACRRP